jgi:histidinol dehydrogenase
MRLVDVSSSDFGGLLRELRRRLSPEGEVVSPASRQRTIAVFGVPLSPQEVVARICKDVAERGVDALLYYIEKLDGKSLSRSGVFVPEEDLKAAHQSVGREFLEVVRRVWARIERFQSAIRHRDVRITIPGGYLEERYRPISRVGVCVPGGAAAYPSTVLMTVVPARVAGVEEIVVATPPTAFGAENPYVLATCWELGVRSVLRAGGAHGVAAMAYGVEGLEPVDKIVGPGNLFVALAKKFVFGRVGIDSVAGPSEVVVIADSSAEPRYLAYDLIAQAEHAPGTSILLAWERTILERTISAVEEALHRVDRAEEARQCLEEFGLAVLTDGPEQACRIAAEIAPEHLHIIAEDAGSLADKIPTAGAVFLGNYSPVACGDYAAGPSHVLPTSGTARFASGLSVNDFLRSHSVICLEREGLEEMAPDIQVLAECEGLTAHRESVLCRLQSRGVS